METWREELYHHGIKGQKWGIRRYQNSDGTWTEEGLRRRRAEESSSDSFMTGRSGKNKNKGDGNSGNDNDPKVKAYNNAAEIARVTRNSVNESISNANRNKKVRIEKSKQVQSMSDQDLRNSINRMQLENSYASLMAERKPQRGKQFVSSILATSAAALTVASLGTQIALNVRDLKSKSKPSIDGFGAGNILDNGKRTVANLLKNPDFYNIYVPAATVVASAAAWGVKKAVNAKQESDKAKRFYDPSSGRYVYAKKKLNKEQGLEYDRRRKKGERPSEILDSMGMLRK